MHVLHVTTDTGETDIVRRELGAVDPDLRVECAGTPREAIERLEAETSPYDADLPPRGCTTCYERVGLISRLLNAAGMTVTGAGGR